MVGHEPAVESLEDLTIGQRVARCRKARGMSQEVLAHLLGRSQSWLTKVERGERQLDRISIILELARVLDVEVSELTGHGAEAGPQAHAAVPAIRRALTRPDPGALDGTRADGVESLATLRLRIQLANRFRHAADFDRLGEVLPSLLEDVQLAAAMMGPEADRRAARELLVETCHCARAMLKALGYLDLAWIATERGREVAAQLGDPLLIGASAWNRAEVLLGNGDAAGAVALVRWGIDSLDGSLDLLPPPRLSLLGMLHLKAALGTASMGDERQARVHVREAGLVASFLGHDRNDFGTLFGPTNVTLHSMGVSMELSLPGEAVVVARSLSGSIMAPERRVRLKVDLARAHAQLRQEREAMRLLVESQRLAPDYLRGHPLAKDTVIGLLQRAPRSMSTDLGFLASRVGL
jgi:transcriptional regulator with XRE-family HTH domain